MQYTPVFCPDKRIHRMADPLTMGRYHFRTVFLRDEHPPSTRVPIGVYPLKMVIYSGFIVDLP